jgi:hypothetical protein
MVFVAAGNKFGTAGWPDRCIVIDGEIYWLEFKDVNTPLAPLQDAVIRKINLRRPKTAFVVRAPDMIEYHSGRKDTHVIHNAFDGTAKGLLNELKRFREQMK